MKYFLKIIFCLIVLDLNAQSPWISESKGGFLQIGYSGLYYNQVRIGSEVSSPNRQTTDQTFQIYADYGINKKLGLMAILPFKNIKIQENQQKSSLNGFSNLTFGLKYLVLDKISKLSIGINYSANTIRQDDVLGLRTGYNSQTILPFVSVGTGTKKMYFYLNFGYGKRTNGYSDFAKISGEMGHKVFKNGYLVGTLDLNRSLNMQSKFYQNEKAVFFKSVNYLDRQLINGFGLKLIYDIIPQKYGFTISSIGSLGAENLPFSRSYNFGIYQKF